MARQVEVNLKIRKYLRPKERIAATNFFSLTFRASRVK
jgi:hypothetical protein